MERRGRKVKGKKRDREREPAEEWGSIMAFKGRKVKGKKKEEQERETRMKIPRKEMTRWMTGGKLNKLKAPKH